MSPWKVILATMVIFGCGVVTGGLMMKAGLAPVPIPIVDTPQKPAVTATNAPLPPPLGQFQQPQFLKRMEKQLDLTPEQRTTITKIMTDSQERTRPLWKLIAPGLRDEYKRVRQEIRQTLNPNQQREFDDLLKAHPRKMENPNGNFRPMRNALSNTPPPTNAP